MAKPPQVTTIFNDDHGPYVIWGSEHSVYRPEPSVTSYKEAFVFHKTRQASGYTVHPTGSQRTVMQTKGEDGEKYLLVYTKNLRELWSWHGTTKDLDDIFPRAYTPKYPSAPFWEPSASAWAGAPSEPGPWHRSKTLVAILRGRLL